MREILLLLLSLVTFSLTAQSFNFPEADTRIYPVPAETVERLSNWETSLNRLPGLGTPYPAGTDVAKLPPGHYLMTTLHEEQVTYAYFHTYKYEVHVDAADGKFQLRLYDPTGAARPDAIVTADGKPVRYSNKHQAYRRRDWRIDGLKIIVPAATTAGEKADTLFYEIREDFTRSRFAHDVRVIGARQPFRTLKMPYYYGRSYYLGLKSGIFHGDWWRMRNVPYPLKNTIRRIRNPKPLTGYVSTSQPRYRPGDTLRMSAYLAFSKGRPLGVDSVDMVIRSYGRGASKRFETKVGRQEKGRYTHIMAIPPDWPLDQDYTVSFSLPGLRWRDIDPSISFKLQDYELAEYKLTTKISDDARLPGSAWLDVKAEDINYLPLPNGEITVTVHLESFVASRDSNTIVLPDTLYTYTEPTNNRKDRRLILPDSIFPQGHSVRIKVETQLTGPSGEYKTANHMLTVDRRYPRIPMLEIRGDSLLTFLAPAAEHQDTVSPTTSPLSRGEGPGEKATLQTISPQNDTIFATIALPYTLPIDHQQTKYRLLYDEQVVSENLTELTPTTGSPTYWSRDTLLLRFPNPNNQPFRWTLYDDGTVLARGDKEETTFIRSGFAPGTELELHYSYLAGGEWRHRKETASTPPYDLLTEHKNVLDLTLTQPAKVRPGETVRIALQATDQKGRPAANVRLTAGTFNARFGDTPVTAPTYSTRNNRRRSRQRYDKENLRINRSDVPPGWLVKDFGLDTALAYQLRYPNGEFTYQRDLDTLLPNRVQHAHFAPFVIKNHKPVTIRTVYADDRLVYWWHPGITTPYSIPVDNGWHTIALRTDEHIYTKKLYFESCRQLVLSFDAERWVSAGWARSQVQKWGDEAVDRIWERVFALSHMRASGTVRFRAGDNGIVQSTNRINNTTWSPAGLAANNDLLQFWFPKGDSVALRFEPRATYRVLKERDRLYPLKREWVRQSLERKAGNGPAAPQLPDYIYQPTFSPVRELRQTPYAFPLPRLVPLEAVSRLQLNNLPETLERIIIAPVGEQTFYYLKSEIPNHIKPGTYDVLYHFKNDSVFHQKIHLPEDNLTLLSFQRKDVEYFNNFDWLEGYSQNTPPKEPEPEVIYVERVFSGDRISGTVLDEDGIPLIGVSIQIEGTNTGTVTDFDGNYTLEVPVGDYNLIFSYTGFTTQKTEFTNTNYSSSPFDVTMEPSSALLEEIVVVGYGVQRKQNLTASVVTSQEIRNLPTRKIDQISSIPAGVSSELQGTASGVEVRGSRSDAVIYYVDGVRVSSTDIPDSELNQVDGPQAESIALNLPPAEIRESFSDYAAYVPEISTDREGKAVFDITFPDDITAWNTFAVGQDRRRRIGFALERTAAFLPLQAQLYLPRFLVEGDQAEAAALAVNREEGERSVRLSFQKENEAARTQDARLVDALEERYPIQAPPGTDSLTYQFTVQALDGDQASDGERRSVAIYPKGTEMVSGELLLLTAKTTALPDEFIRPERGPVTLRLPGNRVQQLLNDLDHIVDYPYACTEQTASRLIGLLQMSTVRKAQGENFERAADIPKMIRRLEKLRKPDGGFGWWASSETSTPWISLHVFRALSMAERAGHPVSNLTIVRRYLLGRLPELPVRDQLQIMLTLGEKGNPPTGAELSRVDTFSAPNDYEPLAIARLRQLRGDTVDVDRLLDSSSTHAALGRYWGRRGHFFYRQPLDGRLACGLLARRILAAEGRSGEAAETVNYLLGQSAARNRPGNVPLLGTNTLESARLLAELLPALLAEDDALAPPAVNLQTGGNATRVTNFPFETDISPSAMADLLLERDGSGPLPVALYQRWFETEPVAKDDGFQLTSQMTDKRGRPLNQLKQGETAYLKVTVTSKSDAEYVLVETPIPAGCSYQNRGEARGPWAVHREYQRDRVAIFCDRLPAGTHTYKVALAPRFSGSYTLNPARAEMQYLPVVNGNGELETVRIE
ncbi:hypothetical protein FUA23_21000 [Neolewinella aurantiaca]|uniref:Alpha-2-macroglobulin domain-containing protein n=1 Tax=Neolewinella aurantiaca TaxID=2602767 RepID=A0A5C7F326_9BACT|nr:carboxypeptidase-like regulatory domain-containing protein [Neolewinella aurantiaca]TXF84723.1 hypothetical protein FUA23_21000 [Neolewinella aurantiaca]